jgi:hypothetical protein
MQFSVIGCSFITGHRKKLPLNHETLNTKDSEKKKLPCRTLTLNYCASRKIGAVLLAVHVLDH